MFAHVSDMSPETGALPISQVLRTNLEGSRKTVEECTKLEAM